uniref:Uncharacterized protein n=1 Tax=Arundo donax TaxID=35708 RepID=A0A0A9EDT3_ARUDO
MLSAIMVMTLYLSIGSTKQFYSKIKQPHFL